MRDSQISGTARLIAKATLLSANQPLTEALVSTEATVFCRAFLQESPGLDPKFGALINFSAIRKLLLLAEKLVKPGIATHYALRKKHIESIVLNNLQDPELTQVVIVGCGFDTLGLRIHNSYPRVGFFELDSKQLIASKSSAVIKCGGTAGNFHFVPLSGQEDAIQSSLENCPTFNKDKKTLFLMEGVLMYLSPHLVMNLFETIREFSRENIAVFTFLEPIGAYEKNQRPLAEKFADFWLKQKGEPYLWSTTREGLEDFSSQVKMKIASISTPSELRKRYLSSSKSSNVILPRDEHVVEAHFKL